MVQLRNLFLLILVTLASAEKILVIFQAPSYSHYILGRKLVHLLTERGHEVTMISPFKDNKKPALCREVILTGVADESESKLKNSSDSLTAKIFQN